ncbi:phage capsid assembly protein [Thiohalobacter sp. COW1]|uniref:S49 family peptidase n=1 Tax=Thiohalobacter sp. COW1 TaxID=2795687 RepID=UPI0019150B5B|nr:S49 family peptidase [Thiohalobacter sp. COW1]BCO30103.1 phage capsid assembly protein [Thiohalobacter sp. COW1]
MQLVHLASRIVGTPLLIARPKLDVILSVLGPRIGLPDVEAASAAVMTQRAMSPAPAGIAVIPIHGTLVRRTLGLEAASGLTSYGEIRAQIDTALADPGIKGILLDVDSPGGEAGGVFELAERIREASAVKPVWAVASDSAFSAAYAIACAASHLAVTRTGGVGSIGVIAMHVDQSVRDAQQGYRYTAITAGKHKNDFSPHEPLDPQAAESLQAEVDRLYGMFVGHVAAMRGLEADAVRATEAGLFFGEQTLTAGLADAVASRDQLLEIFATFLNPQGRSRNPAPQTRPGSAPMTQENDMTESPDPTLEASEAEPDPIGTETETAAEERPTPTPAADRHEVVAIAELCQLGGCPERTAEFLAAGLSEADVRRTLLAVRAESPAPEISSAIHPDAHAAQRASAEHNPLIKAVKHLTGKE